MMRFRILLPAAIAAFLWLQRSRLRKFFFRVKKTTHGVSNLALISRSYTAQTMRVANEIAKGRYDGEIMDHAQDGVLPEKEIWDFKLGDVVEIKYSKEEFKSIQERTVVYDYHSEAAVGHVGIVTTVYSKFANMVGVYFPEMKRSFEIYPGVLKNVENESAANCYRWRIGSYVKTTIDGTLLSVLEKLFYSGSLPKQYVGKKGRVVGTFDDISLVDFGGHTSYPFHDSALFTCNNQSPLERENFSHPRGFKIGDQVRIISNMKTLIKNQKAIRSWNDKMSYLRNQVVKVVYIFGDGKILVQVQSGRPWIVHPDTILKKNQREASCDTGMKVVPGDIVEIDFDFSTDEIMRESAAMTAGIIGQPECFELRRICGKVSEISESFMVKVQFAHELFVCYFSTSLKKVSPEKAERYRVMVKKVCNLKVGDTVRLDVGPVNFVLALLKKLNSCQDVRMALTKPATLLGFLDKVTAVIQYDDGSKYRMPKKYLTVPERYSINDEMDPISVHTIYRIQNKVSEGLKSLDSSKKRYVLLCHVAEGHPPYVVLRVTSENDIQELLLKWLQTNSGWDVEVIGDKQLYISGIEEFKGEVKLGFVFEGEDFRIQEIQGFSAEGAAPVDIKAGPFQRVDDPGHPIPERPHIGGVGDFRFMRLFDPSLGRDLYLPYVIHGPPRDPAPVQQENQVASIMRHVSAIFNMQNSRIGSVTNINEQYANAATPGGQVIVEQGEQVVNNGTSVD